jgi:GDPmannose 4,6-dehydratase|tara:strand:+ start:361 stop:1368 length:1008 start_codon:yes stop_codon:yes gene_type:complete
MKRAFITGLTGQDGSYLSEFLINKGYEVYGLYRRTSLDMFDRIVQNHENLNLVQGDITDTSSLINNIKEINPDEVYNLAAQSFVSASWTQPISTGDITALGTVRLLEAIRSINPDIKYYQASSSEMFGKALDIPQTESTPFYPRSPYGVAKVYGFWITVNYRESFGIHASNGILFNHESPRRGKQFVTRKISHSVAKIKLGIQDYFELGNLNAMRDWGFAGDYVEAMWSMLQEDKPDDYVIATGEAHTVREFVEESFKIVGMNIQWEGSGLNEVGKHNGKVVVKVNEKFYRPAEVELIGSSVKAKDSFGWVPKTGFKDLVKMMVESDLKVLSSQK